MKIENINKQYKGGVLIKHTITIDLLQCNNRGNIISSIAQADRLISNNMSYLDMNRCLTRLEYAIEQLELEASKLKQDIKDFNAKND